MARANLFVILKRKMGELFKGVFKEFDKWLKLNKSVEVGISGTREKKSKTKIGYFFLSVEIETCSSQFKDQG